MTCYVVGFCFDQAGDRVVLVRKSSKPGMEWQAGLLNGVGGKLEPEESVYDAMRREFYEEAGVLELDWECYAIWHARDYALFVFRAFSDYAVEHAHTREAEPIETWYWDDALRNRAVPNLSFLLPMALCRDFSEPVRLVTK